MIWDVPTVDLARRLWQEGVPASRIAAQIGKGVTRSSVLGRLHRLGLCRTSRIKLPGEAKEDAEALVTACKMRAEGYSYEGISAHVGRSREWVRWRVRKVQPPFKPHRWAPRPKAAAPALAKSPSAEAAPEAPEPILLLTPRRISFMQLTPTTCRYPLGDPRDSDFSFCGNSCVPGMSYCDGHHRLCYRPYEPPKARALSFSGMYHPAGGSRILESDAAA